MVVDLGSDVKGSTYWDSFNGLERLGVIELDTCFSTYEVPTQRTVHGPGVIHEYFIIDNHNVPYSKSPMFRTSMGHRVVGTVHSSWSQQ